MKRAITHWQVDNKIRRIERRFKNRNDNRQKSGAGNLSQWNLEERVAATIGDRPTVHVETVSSLRKDNSKGISLFCVIDPCMCMHTVVMSSTQNDTTLQQLEQLQWQSLKAQAVVAMKLHR